MASSWANSAASTGSDLHLDLSAPGSRRSALTAALREAIRSGRLPSGAKLPPYRSLAADLGLARNTVAAAYSELIAEGWLTARQGSGTRVARRAEPRPASWPVRPPKRPAPVHDLRQGQPESSSFPRTTWAASSRRSLHAAPSEAFGPGDPHGRPELRRALADYLARVRGVRAEPERIVICSGFAHGLELLFNGVLRGPVAVESYGLPFHRQLLADAGARTVPLTLDEHGARTDELDSRVRAALLTPAHQFPTGGPLHAERRAAAVDWARTTGGLLLEDDYDGEFRYDREPVGAVQGLDPDRVVYLGSVSKSLSPAVRIGWMVLPEHLVDGVLEVKGTRERWASVLDQLALADFIESGHYDRHVRRMRQRYRRRRDQLLAVLAEHAPHVTASGIAAGLHAVLRLPPGTEQATTEAAARLGIAVEGLAHFRHPDASMPAADGLVVGYPAPPEHGYAAALNALVTALL
ncbi:GntR family transcriptional regulator / MocR family aminotransferase [Saccharopolyspora antimicrobica]|uniref:GntR family transcriptional regulator / MocR family aminotransferase n=1 Tax=Saccharopolyspora antimicrobica TaxID=455193 RepID=A0A1I5LC31_9PSEU|nr:PLP-dependent aminotransferase family protein [Saccharopolyspora antimicrobica]RKT85442.1 GntR family transcriptional regulator/MocR family aminotransferase [Saccharopolyspora antimicrobica]SFO94840.1 GntR family transcriptional regulator / MocR family aminotransferase [Saccharopolyspora antimicrobica]